MASACGLAPHRAWLRTRALDDFAFADVKIADKEIARGISHKDNPSWSARKFVYDPGFAITRLLGVLSTRPASYAVT